MEYLPIDAHDSRAITKKKFRKAATLIGFAILCVWAAAYSFSDSYTTKSTLATTAPINPHILMIVIDDMGYNDIGYGSSDLASATPNLDSLAADGIKFTKMYAQSSCTPSRAALMTGKYPIRLGLQHAQIEPSTPFGLPTSEKILPRYLQELGYTTRAVGKWHLGHFEESMLPTNRGFDSFYGFYSGGENYITHLSEESCDVSYHSIETCYYDLFDNDEKASSDKSNTALFTDTIIDLINNHDATDPVFIYAAFPNPHTPLVVSDADMDRLSEKLDGITNSNRKLFGALMTMLDESVGNIVAALKDNDMYDDTVIIVFSDNGGSIAGGGNNYPLRGEKLYLFEGGVKVQGFMHSAMFPTSSKGTTYDNLFHITDFLPTIVYGMLHGERDENIVMDGIDHFANLFNSDIDGPRDEILLNIDYLDNSLDYLGFYRGALIYKTMKLIVNEQEIGWYEVPSEADVIIDVMPTSSSFTALYDLATDPNETTDVSDVYPGMYFELLEKFNAHLENMIKCSYADADPRAFTVWDANSQYLTPWLGSDSQVMESDSPSRIEFEKEEFGF